MKREIKSTLFTRLFSIRKNALLLYQTLHPEDVTATVDDVKIVTLEAILTDKIYNDLGIRIKDKLIILIEHQSTWSENIVVRIFLYIAQTFNEFIHEHDLDVYGSAKIKLPKPEAYVVYTGDRKSCPKVLSLNKLFWDGDEDYAVDVRVKVLRDGKDGDILNQYVLFTKALAEQVKIYGPTRKAVREAIRICKKRNILREFLQSREKEVVDIMITLFDHQEIQDRYLRHAIADGVAKGIAKKVAKEVAKREAEFANREAEFANREAEFKAEFANREAEFANREAEFANREAELKKRADAAGLENARQIAKKLLAKGLMSHEDIAECAGLPLSEIESLAKKTRKRTK